MRNLFAKKRLIWILLAVFLLTDAALFLSVLVAPPSTLNATVLPTAQYLEQNPAPTPEFILYYWTKVSWYSHFERAIYVGVNQEPFARIGTSADELNQHLFNTYRGEIDGSPAKTDAVSYATLTCQSLDTTLDTSKSRCWGGELVVYFDVSGLSAGLHLATLTIPDLDGVEHTYSWAFRYDPNAPTSDPNIMPTMAVLPSETPPA